MKRSTLVGLGLLVFLLVFVSFLVRGFGQFLVGMERALSLAAPIALVAASLLVFVVAYWLLAQAGLLALEED
jgi:Kef-type K+ transport system membrane component KefB